MARLNCTFNLLLYGIVILFTFNFSANAQNRYEKYKNGIVKIKVIKPGKADETGAGIIISKDLTQAFILTALHVVFDKEHESYGSIAGKKIQVKFRFDSEWSEAAIIEPFDEELDMAIIKVDINGFQYSKIKSSIKLGNVQRLKIDKPIQIIGHPQDIDWKLSSGELKKKDANLLKFTGGIADGGNSGRALFDKKFELIGVVTKADADYGTALKISVAKEMIEVWQVPFDIKPRKTRYWGYTAGALGAAGVTFKIMSDTKYNQYKDADDSDEAERLKSQVETFDIIYPIALAGSALCLTKYLLSARDKKKKKSNIQAEYIIQPEGGVLNLSMKF